MTPAAATLAAIRERHYSADSWDEPTCDSDEAVWPCDAALLLAEIDALRADPCPDCDMLHVWPCPAIPRCDEPGCDREADCGWPSPGGYRRTCGRHMP